MLLSFVTIRQGSVSFPLAAVAIMLRDLALVGLVAFFLWRNGEPAERIGWTFKKRWAARGPVEFVLAAALIVVVAVAEETIFQGYLILRFGSATRSLAAAVILSSFVFSIGHGYEGTAGVATVGVMGLVFALVYIWRRSLVAPMVMHFLQDFLSIVVLPLFLHLHH